MCFITWACIFNWGQGAGSTLYTTFSENMIWNEMPTLKKVVATDPLFAVAKMTRLSQKILILIVTVTSLKIVGDA